MGSPSFTIRRSVAAAVLILGVMVAGTAGAQQTQQEVIVGPGDGAAIRQVIQNQLDAFQRDDGTAAFNDATPMIREMFRTPEMFMSMVKSGYLPVYRPRHVAFAALDTVEGQLTQHVMIVGPDGAEVEALYFMEHEKDGTWLNQRLSSETELPGLRSSAAAVRPAQLMLEMPEVATLSL